MKDYTPYEMLTLAINLQYDNRWRWGRRGWGEERGCVVRINKTLKRWEDCRGVVRNLNGRV